MQPGTKLGPYEILGPLGAGGMGEVYRAQDTRLGRDVAVKILPPHASPDPDLRERFVREARLVSGLGHPNICTLHDVGVHEGIDYLVMELLEGETLAARLAKGPLKLDAALKVAVEIASALDRAHRAGVVHRDLKPANVMLTRTGAKVLDFGIAKLTEAGLSDPAHPAHPGALPTALHTRTTPLTARGAIMGTLGYMSPEQLEGKPVDHRADLFAFGAVLYEMLTGRRAFDGESQAGVIAAILGREPAPPSTVAPAVPQALDRLVKDCLAKDAEERRQSAHDLAQELRALIDGTAARPVAAVRRVGGRWWIPWLVAATALALALVLAAGTWSGWFFRKSAAPRRAVEFTVPLLEATDEPSWHAVSPDGGSIAYSAPTGPGRRGQLWVRRLDDAEPRRVEGAEGVRRPFWSATGREIAYFADGKLWAVAAEGGRPRPVCDAAYGVGGAWAPDGTIVFTRAFLEPLHRVDATGGRPVPVTTLDAARRESAHVWPVFLAGGKRFLFLSRTVSEESNRIEIASLDGGARRVVTEADALVGYVEPDVLFVRGGVMFAQRLDVESGTLTGKPRVVAENVHYRESWSSAGASVAGATLAWTPHVAARVEGQWYDPRGRRIGTAFEELDARDLRLSPDASLAALVAFDAVRGADDLWIFEFARGVKTRLTSTASDEDVGPWLPEGDEVVFSTDNLGPYAIWRVAADGAGTPKPLVFEKDADWQPDTMPAGGRTVIASRESEATAADLWEVPIDAPDRRVAWLETEHRESGARASPDGRWIAYVSDRSGRYEVYLRRREGGASVQVSTGGSSVARWGGDGKSLWIDLDDHLVGVPIRFEGGGAVPGVPDRSTAIDLEGAVTVDVARDGRVLVLRRLSGGQDSFRVRVGW